jgi:hypothetical protein
VYTPYRALYSCFPFRSWCPFLLVSAMFWMNRVHFGLSPTDAGVHPSRRPMAVSTPRPLSVTASASGCCRMFFYSNLTDSVRFDQSFWNSGVGTLAMERVTTTITITVNYIQEPNKTLHLHRPAVKPRIYSNWLHQTGEGHEFATYSSLL